MHYLLGVFMFNKYWEDLFGQTKEGQRLTPGLIYAKSTDTNRTIESLEYLLAGLLASVEI